MSHLERTPIVDKNGKHTTVLKGRAAKGMMERISPSSTPPRSKPPVREISAASIRVGDTIIRDGSKPFEVIESYTSGDGQRVVFTGSSGSVVTVNADMKLNVMFGENHDDSFGHTAQVFQFGYKAIKFDIDEALGNGDAAAVAFQGRKLSGFASGVEVWNNVSNESDDYEEARADAIKDIGEKIANSSPSLQTAEREGLQMAIDYIKTVEVEE